MSRPNDEQPKAAAAKRGCLSARHWQDIRQAARTARSEGITLIIHGVTVVPAVCGKENQPEPQHKSTTTTACSGRGQQPRKAIGDAHDHQPKSQQDQQQPTKQQRENQRSLARLRAFQQALACGLHWLPLVQRLLHQDRVKSRDRVWTEFMRRRLELRDKMRGFLGRVLRYSTQRANHALLVDRDRAADIDATTQATDKLRRMVYEYEGHITLLEARRMRRACSSANARAYMRDLFMAYRDAWNAEAACAGLEPKDTNTKPLQPRFTHHNTLPDLSPSEQRGAKRATKKPTKGSRSRGRR